MIVETATESNLKKIPNTFSQSQTNQATPHFIKSKSDRNLDEDDNEDVIIPGQGWDVLDPGSGKFIFTAFPVIRCVLTTFSLSCHFVIHFSVVIVFSSPLQDFVTH